MNAALSLSIAASKGSFSTAIENGRSYRLFFPEQANTVNLNLVDVKTADGALCGAFPLAWLHATTQTPGQCVPRDTMLSADVSYTPLSLVNIVGPGECRMKVTLPPTPVSWAASFTTTQ